MEAKLAEVPCAGLRRRTCSAAMAVQDPARSSIRLRLRIRWVGELRMFLRILLVALGTRRRRWQAQGWQRDAAGTAPCMSTACKHRGFKGRVTQAAVADTAVQEEGRNGDTPCNCMQCGCCLPRQLHAQTARDGDGRRRENSHFFFP